MQSKPTFFQAHIAVLVVELVPAQGAVELVVGIHLAGGVGDGCGRQVYGGGGSDSSSGSSSVVVVVRVLSGRRSVLGSLEVVCLRSLPLASGGRRRDLGVSQSRRMTRPARLRRAERLGHDGTDRGTGVVARGQLDRQQAKGRVEYSHKSPGLGIE